ncbi:putative arabinose-binding protein [Abditibacteriota bacterium]|nr:putative arabinose-binding protein [Abditibacteriota bacterium]
MNFLLRVVGFSVLCLCIGGTTWLGGCTRQARGGASGVEKHGNKVVIDFWNGFTGPDGKTMEKMVKQFQAQNRDIEVRMQIIPWGTYYDKLTLSLAYGGAPEVFVMPAARLPEFAAFDTLEPITPLLATAGPPLKSEQFAPVPWHASFYKGRQLALPLDVHPIGLYYNTKLFEEAGIVDRSGKAKPPRTLQEFLDDARKITKDTNKDGRTDQWGFVFTNQRSNWLTITGQFGGSILSPDLKTCVIDSDANRKASQLMHDFIYKYKIAPRPEGVDAWLAFRQGKVGMAMEGIYMLASLEEQKGLPFAGAPVPQFGPKSAVWGGSHLLCQPAGISLEASRASWRLMRFLSDNSFEWATGGQVPARLNIQRSPQFAALPVQAQFARQLPFVQYELLSPRANAIFPFVDPAIEAVLLDLQTPEVALKDSQRRIDQVLKRP